MFKLNITSFENNDRIMYDNYNKDEIIATYQDEKTILKIKKESVYNVILALLYTTNLNYTYDRLQCEIVIENSNDLKISYRR